MRSDLKSSSPIMKNLFFYSVLNEYLKIKKIWIFVLQRGTNSECERINCFHRGAGSFIWPIWLPKAQDILLIWRMLYSLHSLQHWISCLHRWLSFIQELNSPQLRYQAGEKPQHKQGSTVHVLAELAFCWKAGAAQQVQGKASWEVYTDCLQIGHLATITGNWSQHPT